MKHELCKSMAFFDLNIPYLENAKSSASSQNQTLKQNRLKFVIRSMEFGYTGVAYNRTIKGVMSDADYCSIPLFTASSLMKLLPALSASAKFHRGLLGVPETAPFRQYTRLTVCVDSAAQAMLLNSTNPVLKSYNIVAAKPLNQNAFDQACQFSEVDIISIDFTERIPFRLRQPIVKAAIKRGVYFEITYYGLIRDVQTRSQVISNARMLVDWTSGKNIILTSATSSANELRGPYDIANLASLLGMSKERAKAAVSNNCRNLISKALCKRQYHNEAIKVELLTASEQLKLSNLSSSDWLNWDPISSGQGDLVLDDVENCFVASGDHSKVKAIDFTSIMNELPSNGLKLKDILSGDSQLPEPQDLVAEIPERSTDETGVNMVIPNVKDATTVNFHSVNSQETLAELFDSIRNATNVEPVLSKSCDMEADDKVAANFQLVPHSVLQPEALCSKDSSNGVEKLVSEQQSQMPSFLTSSSTKHESFKISTLNKSHGSEVLTNPVAIIKESMNSNVSKSRQAGTSPLKALLNPNQFKKKKRKGKGKSKKV